MFKLNDILLIIAASSLGSTVFCSPEVCDDRIFSIVDVKSTAEKTIGHDSYQILVKEVGVEGAELLLEAGRAEEVRRYKVLLEETKDQDNQVDHVGALVRLIELTAPF